MMKREVDALDEAFKTVGDRFRGQDARFEKIEDRLTKHGAHLAGHDARCGKIEDRLATLEVVEQRGDYQAGYNRGLEDGRKAIVVQFNNEFERGWEACRKYYAPWLDGAPD
jgi:hypothetical protein